MNNLMELQTVKNELDIKRDKLEKFIDGVQCGPGWEIFAARYHKKKERMIVILNNENMDVKRIQLDIYPCGFVYKESFFSKLKRKKDYIPIILKKLSNGEKQSDISEELGLSQGYISKVKKRYILMKK